MSFPLSRADQARINGSLSRGPVSADGKARSSRNAVRFGLTCGRPLILQDEDAADYADLRAEYYDEFAPATRAEMDLVDDMIQARWQIRRCQTIETALLDIELDRLLPGLRDAVPDIDPAGALALTFKDLADNSTALALIHRYQNSHARAYQRAMRLLGELRDEWDDDSEPPVDNPPEANLDSAATSPHAPLQASPPPAAQPAPPQNRETNQPSRSVPLVPSAEPRLVGFPAPAAPPQNDETNRLSSSIPSDPAASPRLLEFPAMAPPSAPREGTPGGGTQR